MMRSIGSLIILPSVLLCALASCSPSADMQDEFVGESASQGAVNANTDSAADDAHAYFEVTTDLRRCPSPLCGGWFMRRLDRSTTTCHDGRHAGTCYTPVLDWSEADLSDDQRAKLLDASSKDAVSEGVYAIARGRFEPTNTTPRPAMGRFVIGEAWVAEGVAVSAGVFVKLKDNGLRCFAAPCPNLTEKTLNTPRVADIAELDWTPSGLSDRQIEGLSAAMYGSEGILVAGYRYTVHDSGSTAKGRTATAAYHRLSDATP